MVASGGGISAPLQAFLRERDTGRISRTEGEAQRRGCRFAYVETYSFQGPRFYERNGCSVFGRLAGFSGDHVLFYMRKDLGKAAANRTEA